MAVGGRAADRRALSEAARAAQADCDAALKLKPKHPVNLGLRSLVFLLRNDLVKARADANAALAVDPRLAWPLYLRGTIKRRLNDLEGAKEDIAAAKTYEPKIAERFAPFGIDKK